MSVNTQLCGYFDSCLPSSLSKHRHIFFKTQLKLNISSDSGRAYVAHVSLHRRIVVFLWGTIYSPCVCVCLLCIEQSNLLPIKLINIYVKPTLSIYLEHKGYTQGKRLLGFKLLLVLLLMMQAGFKLNVKFQLNKLKL